MIATTSSTTLYVEAGDEDFECSFQSLEFFIAIFMGEGLKVPTLHLCRVIRASIEQMIRKGVRIGT